MSRTVVWVHAAETQAAILLFENKGLPLWSRTGAIYLYSQTYLFPQKTTRPTSPVSEWITSDWIITALRPDLGLMSLTQFTQRDLKTSLI